MVAQGTGSHAPERYHPGDAGGRRLWAARMALHRHLAHASNEQDGTRTYQNDLRSCALLNGKHSTPTQQGGPRPTL